MVQELKDSGVQLMLLLSFMGLYVAVMPEMSSGLGQMNLFWVIIFVAAMYPGTLYNARQATYMTVARERGLINRMSAALRGDEAHHREWAKLHMKMFILLIGCSLQLVSMLLFLWVPLVTWAPADMTGVAGSNLGQQLSAGFGCFFFGGPSDCDSSNFIYGAAATRCAAALCVCMRHARLTLRVHRHRARRQASCSTSATRSRTCAPCT